MQYDVHGLYLGIVEDNNDPQHRGRLRVRVGQAYGSAKYGMPTESLPWALPATPILLNPPIPVGTPVYVLFEQGRTAYPVYIGYMLKHYNSKCFTCTHLIDAKTCDAFPNGIPDDIYFGDVEHTPENNAYSGLDNGIQYERATEVENNNL